MVKASRCSVIGSVPGQSYCPTSSQEADFEDSGCRETTSHLSMRRLRLYFVVTFHKSDRTVTQSTMSKHKFKVDTFDRELERKRPVSGPQPVRGDHLRHGHRSLSHASRDDFPNGMSTLSRHQLSMRQKTPVAQVPARDSDHRAIAMRSSSHTPETPRIAMTEEEGDWSLVLQTPHFVGSPYRAFFLQDDSIDEDVLVFYLHEFEPEISAESYFDPQVSFLKGD